MSRQDSPATPITRVTHLLIESHDLEIPRQKDHESFVDHLERTLALSQVRTGDVLLVSIDGHVARDNVGHYLLDTDFVMHRSSSVWDIYQSARGEQLLKAVEPDLLPHHTQVRWFAVDGAEVAQVAIYPKPPAVSGVRIWCDPALVILFVSNREFSILHSRLVMLQPLWERLRAHHAPPLIGRSQPALRSAYPVPNQPQPMNRSQWNDLAQAVHFLRQESVVERLAGIDSPRSAVDDMLRSRQEVQRHLMRINSTLYHAHGSVRTKLNGLLELSIAMFADSGQRATARHLTAPHEHLVSGLEETRADFSFLAANTSDTASLVASATIGRLLDRSQANRTVGTAVGAALALVALVSIFAAIAAIPNRSTTYLIALSGWMGVSCVAVIFGVMGLTRLAHRPSLDLSIRVRRWFRSAQIFTAIASPLSFALGGSFANIALVALGAAFAMTAIAIYASMNEFR